ncbi:MAG: FMN-dependent NADH-azoreductase [Anaerocolumna sp.]|jgi:FMN-dependent NADH-azoreductase|nr:FMN-dependent NADH-azoreductase [Anaerocolumna sp.]
MGTVLYIKSNMKPENESKTYKMSDCFIEEYKKNNPDDQIITLDLYKENIDFLHYEDLGVVFGPKNEESKNHPILKYAYQFLNADKFVVAAPLWNLGVPAILKAYIDYICVTGITFKYTENGPVGLCNGKKALFVASRGGDYSNSGAAEYEMGERYMRTIFGFLGITDFTSVHAENVDVQGIDVDKILNDACNRAIELAKTF